MFWDISQSSQEIQNSHLCKSLFFNNVAGLRPATLLKKRLWHGCFPVNFAKFLKHLFSKKPLDNCFCKFIKYKTLINQKPRFQMQAANLTDESVEVKIEAVVLFIILCGTSKYFFMKDLCLNLFRCQKKPKKFGQCYLPRKANIVSVFKREKRKFKNSLKKRREDS